jgi:hypothetical protein
MRLKIQGLRDPGVLPQERLVLEAGQNGDIGSYAIFCTRLLSTGDVSSKVERTFWFPDKKVQAGDLIVLYTKKGTQHDRQNKDNTTTHFFTGTLTARSGTAMWFRWWLTLEIGRLSANRPHDSQAGVSEPMSS